MALSTLVCVTLVLARGPQRVFDLYNYEWPILTWTYPHPPAKFVHEGEERRGRAFNSLVTGGAIVSGGTVRRSILSERVRINSYSEVEDSVLFDNVDVGRNAVVRRAREDYGDGGQKMSFEPYEFDLKNHLVSMRGEEIRLARWRDHVLRRQRQ